MVSPRTFHIYTIKISKYLCSNVRHLNGKRVFKKIRVNIVLHPDVKNERSARHLALKVIH